MEKTQHINFLELKAVYNNLLTFPKETKTQTFTSRYICNDISSEDGENSELEIIRTSKEISMYLLSRSILMTGDYLPSKLSYVGDQKSR